LTLPLVKSLFGYFVYLLVASLLNWRLKLEEALGCENVDIGSVSFVDRCTDHLEIESY
jgi:hypothetical protein